MTKNEQNKKIKVAFPHMGTIYIAWAAGLRKIGVEPFIPPYTNKKTLSYGTKHSPEAICLPYKFILGNFIEAIENGTDYVAMISSPGICRLGEYGSSIKSALHDLGYDANYIELALYDGIKGMYNFAKNITGKNDPMLFIRGILATIKTIFVLDDLETALSYYRAREIKAGDAEKHFNKGLKFVMEARNSKELKTAKKQALAEIAKTKIDKEREILHVDLTGEIFLVLDYFSNQNIERELGKMGVQVRRSLTVGSFLKDAIIPKFFRKIMKTGETHLQRAFRMAQPYLMRDIGGDALECVSDVAWAHEQGKDGLIHISPFTCMPEIMSQNIFPNMREDCNIPVLTLIMDEQTGKAGYITRLEAFVDLMRRRKRRETVNGERETEKAKSKEQSAKCHCEKPCLQGDEAIQNNL